MPKVYDATGKELLITDPVGWASFMGVKRDAKRIKLIDTDLSSITAAADKALLIDDPDPWIVNVEFLSWCDPFALHQLFKYNALLFERHRMPVESYLVVLTKQANSPSYTGSLSIKTPLRSAWHFPYNVIRVWELSPDELLSGPLGLLPLAPVSAVPLEDVPRVLGEVSRRLSLQSDQGLSERLMVSVAFLLELRYGKMTTEELLKKYPGIQDTAMYRMPFQEGLQQGKLEGLQQGKLEGLQQGKLEGLQQGKLEGMLEGKLEGRMEAIRTSILKLGPKRLGVPQVGHVAILTQINDFKQLEAISDRLLDAANGMNFSQASEKIKLASR